MDHIIQYLIIMQIQEKYRKFNSKGIMKNTIL